MSQPTLPDARCLEHDHHFADEDLYDEYGEPYPGQIEARCTRCGKSMRESLQEMCAEMRAILDRKVN